MVVTLHEHELFTDGPVWGGLHHLSTGIEPHTHDFLEIAIIGPGGGTHVTSVGERPLRHGDAIVVRPGAWHAFTGCAGLTVANCCLSAHALRAELYRLPLLRRLLWTDPVSNGARGVAVRSLDPPDADEAIEQIARLQRDLRAGRRRPGRMLGHLITVLGIMADSEEPEADALESTVHPAVAETIERLEAAPSDQWRLDDLARAVNLDPAYLGRLFGQYTGLTPLGFLARVRAERAAALLVNSTLPVARVGAAVGWPDPTYFARRFKHLVGLTPTEYRHRNRPITRT
ncbi:AraC family transcriptional regulator [Spirillospora sp. NPDC047279]|uniref:AraC family transcriptional regulator n=1 Tax=Spirillospora sp. NPDC047279 TaxID=3155478 RepID=UPI00340664AC